jgi:uncharacterized membrane protein HdeD (DUF308 family)
MRKSRINIIKAILFIVFGILIIINPSDALILLATYFGILAIAGGLLNLFMAFRYYRKYNQPGPGLIEGIISSVIGIIIISYPELSVSLFIIFFGIWALIMGIIQLIAYRSFSEWNFRSGSLLFSAILSLIVAAILLFRPFESAGIIAIIISVYAIIYGASLLINSLK